MIHAALLLAFVPPADFDATFTGRTLRFDYHHVGTATEQHVAYAGLRIEGEWPGSRKQLVDPVDLGKYRFRVLDVASGDVLFARGFCSIFGEWETTGEAKQSWRAFEESQRFPEPRRPVFLALDERGDDGAFHEFWRQEIDPTSRFVDRSPLVKNGDVITLRENGPAATKVDLLVIADGYTAAQRGELEADAKRLTDTLLATQPFARHASDFNVRVLHMPAPSSGISNPRKGDWKTSQLGLSFNAFDSDRYVLTFSDRVLREAAANVPYDALILLANERKYGGGGIYNLWATCAADTEPSPYVFVHEFGHSFAGLADEYYSSQVAYEDFVAPGVEPWEPNVTALLDPSKLKWRDLVIAGTPLPTPWGQAKYDEVDLAYQKKRKAAIDAKATEETNEALMREIKTQTQPLIAAEKFVGKVGAFEGAAYQAKGLYRPEVDCIMFTRNPTSFCRVCERALERTIARFTE
ncbi:MAG: IgA Peptidase M64 [Planctomycetes bacterium]|nr:IgA Peptidase M64 [Planctomycetota bacterium]